MQVSKVVALLVLLPKRPLEFYDRVMTVLEARQERARMKLSPSDATTLDFTEALSAALKISREQISEILKESELQRIEKAVAEGIAKANATGPFDSGHNGDFLLARSAYVICRVLSPDVAVETGVAYGVTSAFVLQAMAVNGKGTLLSIDLPPLGSDPDRHVGAFVPKDLRGRWHLYRGPAKRLLPKLLPTSGRVNLFIHDSLHTYRNMSFEFRTVWPYLGPGALLVADDVESNQAFRDFAEEMKPTFSAVVRENKNALFGILAKRE